MPSTLLRSIMASASVRQIVSGTCPHNPLSAALMVPCPAPVAASDPYRSICTFVMRESRLVSISSAIKRLEARIGPTVWELEGPMPMLKSSNTLISYSSASACFCTLLGTPVSSATLFLHLCEYALARQVLYAAVRPFVGISFWKYTCRFSRCNRPKTVCRLHCPLVFPEVYAHRASCNLLSSS